LDPHIPRQKSLLFAVHCPVVVSQRLAAGGGRTGTSQHAMSEKRVEGDTRGATGEQKGESTHIRTGKTRGLPGGQPPYMTSSNPSPSRIRKSACMVAAWWMAYSSLSRRMDFSAYLGRLHAARQNRGGDIITTSIKPKQGWGVQGKGGEKSHVGALCGCSPLVGEAYCSCGAMVRCVWVGWGG
jgi:hypothetical protein